MPNDVFKKLRRQMTMVYAAIFGVLILAVVFAAYFFMWHKLLDNEKESLVAQIYHEAEEYTDTGEYPVSEISVKDGSMLAYMVTADGKTVLLDQLQGAAAGRAIKKHAYLWQPLQDEKTKMLRMRDEDGKRYRYLAAVAPVMDQGKKIGRLYMFKNMEFYYRAGYETIVMLLLLALVLFGGACAIGYRISEYNVRPVRMMYEKQKQFTADASHEMRTPLTVLNLSVQGLLADTESRYSSFARETLQMMETEVGRLRKLIKALMDLARYDELQISLSRASFNISALCRMVTGQYSVLAAQKKMTVAFEAPAELYIEANKDYLNMLLVILLDNALKYSDRGIIKVSITDAGDSICLAVADNGIGISDADKKKIFDRFYRVDKVRSRDSGGLGLGLALARSIVRLHGGKIFAEDNKPCGTIMKVIFYK